MCGLLAEQHSWRGRVGIVEDEDGEGEEDEDGEGEEDEDMFGSGDES